MQGQNDPKYESIIKAITAITFLATPHRGTGRIVGQDLAINLCDQFEAVYI